MRKKLNKRAIEVFGIDNQRKIKRLAYERVKSFATCECPIYRLQLADIYSQVSILMLDGASAENAINQLAHINQAIADELRNNYLLNLKQERLMQK